MACTGLLSSLDVSNMQGKIYGYARCSTTEKRQDIERQVAELYSMGANFVIQEFDSGGNTERVRFGELLTALSVGDSVYATEVSRVTRSLKQLCEIIELAKAKQLLLKFGVLEFNCKDGRLAPFPLAMLQIMGVFAELERNLATERINSGLAHAKSKGVKLGRPKKTAVNVPVEMRKYWYQYTAGKLTVAEYAKLAGLSRPTVYKYIKLLQQE